jgi:hypothetical protein
MILQCHGHVQGTNSPSADVFDAICSDLRILQVRPARLLRRPGRVLPISSEIRGSHTSHLMTLLAPDYGRRR